MHSRRTFLTAAAAAGISVVLDESIASRYWPERQYPASVKTDCLAPSVLPEMCKQLRSRGYKESAIRAIMSGNFRRVASKVWAT